MEYLPTWFQKAYLGNADSVYLLPGRQAGLSFLDR